MIGPSYAGRLFLSFVLAMTGFAAFRALVIPLSQKVLLRGDGEGEFLPAFHTDQKAVLKCGFSHLLLLEQRFVLFPR